MWLKKLGKMRYKYLQIIVLFRGYRRVVPDETIHLSHNCYYLFFNFVLPLFQSGGCFLGIYYILSIVYTNCSTLFLRDFSAANFLAHLRKFIPRAQQQPVHRFPSHQQLIDLNNWKKTSISVKQSLNFWIIIEQ